MNIKFSTKEAARVSRALQRGINTFDSNSRDEKNIREAFLLMLSRIQAELRGWKNGSFVPYKAKKQKKVA